MNWMLGCSYGIPGILAVGLCLYESNYINTSCRLQLKVGSSMESLVNGKSYFIINVLQPCACINELNRQC